LGGDLGGGAAAGGAGQPKPIKLQDIDVWDALELYFGKSKDKKS
jgi:hypothetical protein